MNSFVRTPDASQHAHEPRVIPSQPDDVPAECAVAIIMDGNGRWAQLRGLDVNAGHAEGGRTLRRTVEAALDLRVRELTVYAFSTENWQRPEGEVAGIMELFVDILAREVPDMRVEGVRMRFIGRRDGLAERVLRQMEWAESETMDGDRLTLVIAFNYGGRAEIVDAARAIALAHGAEAITEASISRHLYAADLAEPDLIIRTGGDQRTSNFLVWQGAYAELVFTDVLWPDFRMEDLASALREFGTRERRFGARDECSPAGDAAL